ncbi:TPA: hypothetical protein SMR47_000126 [Pseudomonas putida]|nr:hypothetical protein [Pseudomonas putida]
MQVSYSQLGVQPTRGGVQLTCTIVSKTHTTTVAMVLSIGLLVDDAHDEVFSNK